MIIITGSSGGIGLKLTELLSKYNKILGIYHKNKPKKKLSNVKFIRCNLSEKSQIKLLEKKIRNEKKIIFISLAGIKENNLLVSQSDEKIQNMLDLNIKSNIMLSKMLLKKMIFSKWGRLIFFSSTGASRGDIGISVYAATKTSLIGLSKVLSKEYGKYNITSNILDLGAFDAGMYRKLKKDSKKKILENLPNKELGNIKNIALAVKFLIENDFVNGSVIKLDGGAD